MAKAVAAEEVKFSPSTSRQMRLGSMASALDFPRQEHRQDAEEEVINRSAVRKQRRGNRGGRSDGMEQETRDRWAPPSMHHGGLDEIEEAPVNGEL